MSTGVHDLHADAFLPIDEDWLKQVGFKWHQLDRQPDKHWLLWLGDSAGQGRMTTFEDIGIEVAPNRGEKWFCWLRSDAAGRYHRFIHLRYLSSRRDLIALVEAISGQNWFPENHLYGSCRTPEQAARIRQRDEELDRKMQREHPSWYPAEKDPSGGRALPEHLEAHEKAPHP